MGSIGKEGPWLGCPERQATAALQQRSRKGRKQASDGVGGINGLLFLLFGKLVFGFGFLDIHYYSSTVLETAAAALIDTLFTFYVHISTFGLKNIVSVEIRSCLL